MRVPVLVVVIWYCVGVQVPRDETSRPSGKWWLVQKVVKSIRPLAVDRWRKLQWARSSAVSRDSG